MNYLDIAILVILAGFTLKGLLRGLLKEICSLAGLLVGALVAFRFHAPFAQWLLDSAGLPSQLAVAAAFLALFLLSVIFFAALGYLLSKFVHLIFLGGFNRLLGAVFGFGQAVVLLAVVLFALSLGSLPEFLENGMSGSQLAPPFVELGEGLFHGGRDFLADR
ncbi:membrane protein required for colicin V production [Geoalkalibacter ferrihydriticus]|uniref:Colicin V production protein n=2 Tax=Geoalkalibacter ferrihydriticus TaxID=392333 RepID=A0A0C2EBJ0_9BACT|nr:CvpA family protein [Geoalkalibacter ferrihydriticus]KIH75953.1 colicin V production protein [Geoalkalibacter ferrihydriticus DSM 17813]SDM56737.1 membrane protein required for colicin V production [Geoalkalibacter ferrihydriticus]